MPHGGKTRRTNHNDECACFGDGHDEEEGPEQEFDDLHDEKKQWL